MLRKPGRHPNRRYPARWKVDREGETKDLFFHSKELSGVTYDELKVGDVVSFEVVDGEKGPAAVNVTRA